MFNGTRCAVTDFKKREKKMKDEHLKDENSAKGVRETSTFFWCGYI